MYIDFQTVDMVRCPNEEMRLTADIMHPLAAAPVQL